jgi:hypothetical protein
MIAAYQVKNPRHCGKIAQLPNLSLLPDGRGCVPDLLSHPFLHDQGKYIRIIVLSCQLAASLLCCAG